MVDLAVLHTITTKLPMRRLRTPTSYNHFYGVADAAARYCKLSTTPTYSRGHWVHNWYPPGYADDPRMIIDNMHEVDQNEPILVSRVDQADLLTRSGYSRVVLVGHPLIYQPDKPVERIPGLLVAMPCHTTETENSPCDVQEYANQVASFRDKFLSVVACIHPADWAKGFWPAAFRNVGIPAFKGAYARDFNSQPFLAAMFGLADTVVTNGFGSHWAYASLFGAKLSIFGMGSQSTREALLQDLFWLRNQDLIDRVVERLGRLALQTAYPSFFVPPDKAQAHREWGARELGAEHRLPPARLARVLGWSTARSTGSRVLAFIQRVAKQSLFEMVKTVVRTDYRSAQRLANGSEDDESVLRVGGVQVRGLDKQSLVANHNRYFVRRVLQFPATLGRPVRVIDGDPGEGLSLLAVRHHHPSASVIAFEPRAAVRKVLAENCGRPELAGVTVEPTWLGSGEDSVETVEFMTDADRHVWLEPPETPQVPLRSLLEEPVDLLKLGHHRVREVLTAAADRLGVVRYLYCQVATDVSAPQEVDLVLALLKAVGFRVFIENEVAPHTPLWFRPPCEGREMIVHLYCNR